LVVEEEWRRRRRTEMERVRDRRKATRVFVRDICSPGIPSVYVDLPSMFLAEPVVGLKGADLGCVV
jgi:hypothetical protein